MAKSLVSPSRIGLAIFSAMACALLALPALADSQARIVRLSDVQGSVEIDKNGVGFERAFLNLPITQGTQIHTRDTGRAEIEFEDGSTLRLGPNATVQFGTLNINDAGKRVSIVSLMEGMAYLNWLKNGDDFTLNFAHEKIALDHPAHFRVEVSPQAAKVGVFKGDIDVTGDTGNVSLGKKKEATFDSANGDKSTLANLDKAPLDNWDKESLEYHEQYAHNNSTPYGYGFSDLNYYGAYQNVPGFGMMWQPYFAGVGWDPFMDGAWSYYPGFGSMFVSAYPWGWLPYRYGSWMFVPGFGWMWQGGNWSNFATVPRFTGTMPVHFTAPVAPKGTNTVVVGRGGFVSTVAKSSLVVNRGSAGMGIARGSLANMHQLNSQVTKSGPVAVRSQPQFSSSAHGCGSYAPARSSAPSGGSSVGHSSMGSSMPSGGHASSGGGSHH